MRKARCWVSVYILLSPKLGVQIGCQHHAWEFLESVDLDLYSFSFLCFLIISVEKSMPVCKRSFLLIAYSFELVIGIVGGRGYI